MILVILAVVVGLLPYLGLFFWLRKRNLPQEDYVEACNKSLLAGFFAVIPVIAGSAVLQIVGNLIKIREVNMIAGEIYFAFLLPALVEEGVKFFCMKYVIKKYRYSWLSVTIFMTIVASGFGILESLVYAFETNPIQILIRGVTMMHAGYGFIIGYFYGKSVYTKNRGYAVFGFILAWLLHGLYDFTLSENILALSDMVAFIPWILVIAAIVTMILFIRFVIKGQQKEEYITLL